MKFDSWMLLFFISIGIAAGFDYPATIYKPVSNDANLQALIAGYTPEFNRIRTIPANTEIINATGYWIIMISDIKDDRYEAYFLGWLKVNNMTYALYKFTGQTIEFSQPCGLITGSGVIVKKIDLLVLMPPLVLLIKLLAILFKPAILRYVRERRCLI